MGEKPTRRALLALGGSFAATTLSWAATDARGSASVDILGGSNGVPSGDVVSVSEMSDTLSVTRGRASVTSGVGLYELTLPDDVSSDELQITLVLTNPNELRGVLGNPNAWIEVAVYESDSTDPEEYIGDSIGVSKDPGASASKRLTKQRAAGTLMPTVSVSGGNVYVAATVKVPGGFPPGQQTKNSLEFFIDVRKA